MDFQPPLDRPACTPRGSSWIWIPCRLTCSGVLPGAGRTRSAGASVSQRAFQPDLPAADGERDMVLRRPPFGAKIKSAHDMLRNTPFYLRSVYPKVPHPLDYCDDDSVIGAPFYVMERLSGIILRGVLPYGLHLGTSPCGRYLRTLSITWWQSMKWMCRLPGLADLGHPEGYAQRQVEGWTRRYDKARTDDIPAIERTAAWLAKHMPPESGSDSDP